MTNEIVKKEENAVVSSGEGRGLEDLGGSEMSIPRYTIVQPVSKEGTPGKIRNTLTGEEHDSVRGVFLSLKKSRVLFGDLGQPPTCRSFDGNTPDPAIKDPPCNECSTNGRRGSVVSCPRAFWPSELARVKNMSIEEAIKAVYGNQKPKHDGDPTKCPPACHLSYNLLGIHNGLPYIISFRRNTTKNIKKFLSACKAYMLKTKSDLCQCEVTLELSKQSNAKGVYYVPVFKDAKWLTKEEAKQYIGMYDSLSSRKIDMSDEPPAEEVAEPNLPADDSKSPF